MVVTLGVGSLAVVSLVVVTVVCVLVTLLLTILNRSSRPRMEHCSHCHRPVFIKGAKVPPYYNCQLSPRAAGPVTWSPGEGGQISCLLEGQPSAHNSLVFKRSCSTRKKIRTHPSQPSRAATHIYAAYVFWVESRQGILQISSFARCLELTKQRIWKTQWI